MQSVDRDPASDEPAPRFVTRRPAAPELSGLLGTFWASASEDVSPARRAARERVLPTGHAHLVFRLEGPPLSLYDTPDGDGPERTVGQCIVGGAREYAYLRAVDPGSTSVGVELFPGAVPAFFGMPAWELAGRHWSLADLWGADAARLRERLYEAGSPERRIGLLEHALVERLRAPTLHPAVAASLRGLADGERVRSLVRESGYSHRRFLTLFRDAVGLAPKAWSRVQRFRRAVLGLRADAAPAGVAALEFADQPHLTREFRRSAGMTPAEYRKARPAHPHHVPFAR
jgi:AraC-like DNA-binding protein